jgi:dUTP pyrophosphatase
MIDTPVRELTVQIRLLPHAKGMPVYSTAQSAGMDLMAAIEEDIILQPMERKLIPSGFILVLEEGFEAQIRPRSGLALKFGLTVLNTPGTIDSDYRGEVQVLLINFGSEDFIITPGMRIAQMVIASHASATLDVVTHVPETGRGEGGFGSTGH